MIAVRDSIFPAPASSRSGVKFMKGECYTCGCQAHKQQFDFLCIYQFVQGQKGDKEEVQEPREAAGSAGLVCRIGPTRRQQSKTRSSV